MGKIRFATGTEKEIVSLECLEAPKEMLNIILPKGEMGLSEFEVVFSATANTKRITLLDDEDQEIAMYTNYTKLGALIYDPENLTVSVGIERADETALRIAELEEQMTDAQMALCDIYEILVG